MRFSLAPFLLIAACGAAPDGMDDTGGQCSGLGPVCQGTPTPCSSYGAYDTSSARQCAYHYGCTPDFDSKRCMGTPDPCAEFSERNCLEQAGCSLVGSSEGTAQRQTCGDPTPDGPPSTAPTPPGGGS